MTHRIGIIGAGMIGHTLATLWSRAGHELLLSSRHPDQIDAPDGVAVGTVLEASRFGEVVLLAIPFAATAGIDADVKRELGQRIVIDAGNPFARRDGAEADAILAEGRGSGRWTAAQLPGARVVKAFNTVYFENMLAAARGEKEIGVPLAADDPAALAVVEQLVRDAGMTPVVAGDLGASARFEPGTALWNSGASADAVRAALDAPSS